MVKILAIQKDIKNLPVYNEGYRLYKESLESIGYEVEIHNQSTTRVFTALPFNNSAVGSGIGVKPEEILAEAGDGYRLAILTYSTPDGTNPAQYPYNLRGCTPISMPEKWYGTYANVLCEFLLHETAHAAQMFAQVPDTVHLYLPEFNNRKDYYLSILTKYRSSLDIKEEVIIINNPTNPTLRQGSRGEAVKELQKLLGITTDGVFGSITTRVTVAFQLSRKLKPDGIVGKMTWAELKKKSSLGKWKLSPEMEVKAEQFLIICKAKGYNIKITSGGRTQAEQDELYAQGRTKPGLIVTNTRNSKHIGGNAFDIAFNGSNPYPNFDWEILGKIGESLCLKWGGRFKSFKDVLHFEI